MGNVLISAIRVSAAACLLLCMYHEAFARTRATHSTHESPLYQLFDRTNFPLLLTSLLRVKACWLPVLR